MIERSYSFTRFDWSELWRVNGRMKWACVVASLSTPPSASYPKLLLAPSVPASAVPVWAAYLFSQWGLQTVEAEILALACL